MEKSLLQGESEKQKVIGGKLMKKARYIIEKYRDKYHSLYQAIEIDLFKNKQ